MPFSLQALRPLLAAAVDLLWPPCCAACQREAFDAAPDEGLCTACAALLEPPMARCPRCARALGPAVLPGPCRRCADERWAVDGLVAGHAYRGVARRLVLALKFRQRVGAAAPLSRRLTDALLVAGLPGDLLVPLPLAPARERRRGYNQALLLAEGVARRTGLELARGGLRRRRLDPAQSGLARGARRRSPRGAFAADPRRFAGRCALLIDDVLTSGATALAAARALYRAGALHVVVAVACRSEAHPGAERRAQALPSGGGAGGRHPPTLA